MNLIDKLGKRISALGLAGSLLFQSGCETTDMTPDAHGQTDPAGKVINNVLDFATGGIFNDQKGGWANPKPKVIVNNYPAQQQAVQPATLLFASNGYQDRNGDGAISYPQEFNSPGKTRFSPYERIEIVFYRQNHASPIAARGKLTYLNTQESPSGNEYRVVGPNHFITWQIANTPQGTYKYEVFNDKNEVLGTTFFEVISN